MRRIASARKCPRRGAGVGGRLATETAINARIAVLVVSGRVGDVFRTARMKMIPRSTCPPPKFDVKIRRSRMPEVYFFFWSISGGTGMSSSLGGGGPTGCSIFYP